MRIGEVYVRQGRLQGALTLFDEVRPVLHELGDRRWEAMTILHAGEAKAQQGRLEHAQPDFDQALSVFRETGDRRFAAITQVKLGEARARQGRLDEALAAIDEAVPILQDLGDRLRTAEALRARGRTKVAGGERAAATEDLRAALRLYVQLERYDDAQELQAELARLDHGHG
jgi:tetratricopeptide (TPR) repeat protein